MQCQQLKTQPSDQICKPYIRNKSKRIYYFYIFIAFTGSVEQKHRKELKCCTWGSDTLMPIKNSYHSVTNVLKLSLQ